MIRPWRCAIALFAMMTPASHAGEAGYMPPNGFVPDAATAVAIAEAILIPIYGRAQIEGERPFSASLEDGRWTVAGHLSCGMCVGGTAVAVIDKATGRIITVFHSK